MIRKYCINLILLLIVTKKDVVDTITNNKIKLIQRFWGTVLC